MRTNIDIDDDVLDAAMRAGGFKTKKDAVEAGLKMIARQAAYREILRWQGKLHWDGDDEDGAAAPTGLDLRAQEPDAQALSEPLRRAKAKASGSPQAARKQVKAGHARR